MKHDPLRRPAPIEDFDPFASAPILTRHEAIIVAFAGLFVLWMLARVVLALVQ